MDNTDWVVSVVFGVIIIVMMIPADQRTREFEEQVEYRESFMYD